MHTGVRKVTAQTAEQLSEKIRGTLDRPIVLIGMMGAGKSKLGRMLAKVLDIPFYDSDVEIEQSAGCSVSEIFEKLGEPAFRAAEARVFARLVGQGVAVIASGGGAVMTPSVADLVFNQTLALWVRAELDVMVDRNSRHDNRPLLKGKDARQVLTDLMAVRYPVYSRAHMTVESQEGPATDTLYQAISAIADHLDSVGVSR